MVDAASIIHLSVGEQNVAFVLFFELINTFGKIPCLAAAASLLSFSFLLRSVLKFHNVSTSLMRNFDLSFFQAMVLYFLGYLLDVA